MDNIDALDILTGAELRGVTTDGLVSAESHGIRFINGDCNNNGLLGLDDYVGPCAGLYGTDGLSLSECLLASGPGGGLDVDGPAIRNVNVGPVYQFDPSVVTIQSGDTVHWEWVGPIPNNVESGRDGVHDMNFRSGDPTAAPNDFDHLFSQGFLNGKPMPANVYPYYSEEAPTTATGVVAVRPRPCAMYDYDDDEDIDLFDVAIFMRFVSAVPVIDGTADAVYGSPVSVQANATGFGDSNLGMVDLANGSELDAAYAVIADHGLFLLLAGNLESNFNKLEIFFDVRPGGQNKLRGDNAPVDSNGLNRMGDDGSGNGLRFDVGFRADYWIGVTGGGGPYTLYANWARLLSGGGGIGRYLGVTGAGSDGTLTGGSNPDGIKATINNMNIAGVDTVNVNDPASVQTGVELFVPWAALGGVPDGAVRICTFINGQFHDHVSNQTLGPLPFGTGNLAEPRLVVFRLIDGSQWFSPVLLGP
ncbi:MAG: hypothetical protein GY778_26335 [bacterium]|nr:hypothetical protein [bacterium]